MKTTIQLARRGFTLVELLVVIVIIAALAGLSVPQIIKMKKRADVAEAISNAKQLGLALAQFDADVGGFPDDSTVDAIERLVGEAATRTLTGADSNSYFRQLFEAGVVDSEQPFYAKSSYTKVKPDDAFLDDEALAAGECGFGYIMESATKSISVSGSRPVAAAPLVAGDTNGEMETDPYDGKAVVLFADNSARQLNIRRTDKLANLASGKHILEGNSDDTVWGDVQPIIKPPLE
jgi:prepilin-type N-terminal cleavage/methylation domain-containing protein